MTTQQLQNYNRIIQYLSTQNPGYPFCLNKAFYQSALPNTTLTNGDKRTIGRYFKQQVITKAIKVDFDYIFPDCSRCGFKDTKNHIHYITIK